MKILIAFYSLSGNTKKLAQAVGEAAGGEVFEIQTKVKFPKIGFLKYLNAGWQACRKELPAIVGFGKNIDDYDLIFLGTPVWGDNFVPAVRSFLKQNAPRNKKVALFCAHGGDTPGQSLTNLEKELAGNEIVAKIDFKMDGISETQMAENLKKISDWAKDIAG